MIKGIIKHGRSSNLLLDGETDKKLGQDKSKDYAWGTLDISSLVIRYIFLKIVVYLGLDG